MRPAKDHRGVAKENQPRFTHPTHLVATLAVRIATRDDAHLGRWTTERCWGTVLREGKPCKAPRIETSLWPERVPPLHVLYKKSWPTKPAPFCNRFVLVPSSDSEAQETFSGITLFAVHSWWEMATNQTSNVGNLWFYEICRGCQDTSVRTYLTLVPATSLCIPHSSITGLFRRYGTWLESTNCSKCALNLIARRSSLIFPAWIKMQQN